MTYLDYNATAPMLPSVQKCMQAALQADWKNPSSLHQYGQQAKSALEQARGALAETLDCNRRAVHFTSGGSEANTMALRWLAECPLPVHLICSPIEHPSVLEHCHWLAQRGVEVSWFPVDSDGRVEVEALPSLLRKETKLVSLMAVNNETGVIQPIGKLAELLRQHQQHPVLLHCDAVQGWGRMELLWQEWGVDLLTITAHKLGGPKGVGALLIREGKEIAPLILGGKQERGMRAGTEAVFLIEGMVEAASWHRTHGVVLQTQLGKWRQRMLSAFLQVPGFFQNGAEHPMHSVCNTLNIGFDSVSAQSVLMHLDLQGVAISTGSACSSGAVEPSHVLLEMGCSKASTLSSLRISMGHATTADEVDQCIAAMHLAVDQCLANRPLSHAS